MRVVHAARFGASVKASCSQHRHMKARRSTEHQPRRASAQLDMCSRLFVHILNGAMVLFVCSANILTLNWEIANIYSLRAAGRYLLDITRTSPTGRCKMHPCVTQRFHEASCCGEPLREGFCLL